MLWLLACTGPASDKDSPTLDTAVEAPTCGVVETFEDGLSPTATLRVPSDYATVEEAAAAVQPGEAIWLEEDLPGGVTIQGLRGTADAPIWIGGGGLMGASQGLHLSQVSYVIVHNLHVDGGSANGINIDDGGVYDDPTQTHHVIVRDVTISDIGDGGNQDCLKLSGVNDFVVRDSTFGGCSSSGVDHVGCHDGLLVNNHFESTGSNGVQNKGGTSNIEIRHNVFVNAGTRAVNAGGSTGAEFFRPPISQMDEPYEARDIRVLGNRITGSEAAVAYVGCVDCVVAQNTVLNPDKWVLRILQETTQLDGREFQTVQNGVFENNAVVFDDRVSTFVNIGPDTAPETFTFANNLWYRSTDPANSTPELPVTETDGVYGVAQSVDGGAPSRLEADLHGVCYLDPPSIGAEQWSLD